LTFNVKGVVLFYRRFELSL